jgi:hypothetical protein
MPSKLEARVTQHDREIAAIRKLILQGMKMLVENGTQIKALAAAQRYTDKKLDALAKTVDRFIRSLERSGSNGHGKTDLR